MNVWYTKLNKLQAFRSKFDFDTLKYATKKLSIKQFSVKNSRYRL